MKITKTQLQQMIREEMENLKSEGYMGAYDRENREADRERARRMQRIRDEEERKRQRGGYRSPGAGSGMGGIGGGGSGKKRFPGFNRDDETADQREDHNIDDLYAMVRDLEAKMKDLKDKK
tara:strand:- start:195 stop:557 length:363 start_codon:yes stop_codon:yes gene_type:complete